jgi:hypothetical protein
MHGILISVLSQELSNRNKTSHHCFLEKGLIVLFCLVEMGSIVLFYLVETVPSILFYHCRGKPSAARQGRWQGARRAWWLVVRIRC